LSTGPDFELSFVENNSNWAAKNNQRVWRCP